MTAFNLQLLSLSLVCFVRNTIVGDFSDYVIIRRSTASPSNTSVNGEVQFSERLVWREGANHWKIMSNHTIFNL